jgi:hypothetical protein
MLAGNSRAIEVVTGLGPSIAQFAIENLGATGAVAAAAGCNAVMVSDAALLASGATRELKRGPAGLLVIETVLAVIASALSIRLLVNRRALEVAMGEGRSTPEVVRRVVIAALFAIRTGRYSIYHRPDRGRRVSNGSAIAAGR